MAVTLFKELPKKCSFPVVHIVHIAHVIVSRPQMAGMKEERCQVYGMSTERCQLYCSLIIRVFQLQIMDLFLKTLVHELVILRNVSATEKKQTDTKYGKYTLTDSMSNKVVTFFVFNPE